MTLALIHRDVQTKGIPSVSCYFPIKSTLSAQKGTLATLQEVPGEDLFYLRPIDFIALQLWCNSKNFVFQGLAKYEIIWIDFEGNRYDDGFDFGAWVFICNIPYIEGIKEDSQVPETMTMGDQNWII